MPRHLMLSEKGVEVRWVTGKMALRDTEATVSTGSITRVATLACSATQLGRRKQVCWQWGGCLLVAGCTPQTSKSRGGQHLHEFQAALVNIASRLLTRTSLPCCINNYTLWKPFPQQTTVFQFRQEGKHKTSFSYHVQNKRFGQILTKSMTHSHQLQLWILNIDFSQ